MRKYKSQDCGRVKTDDDKLYYSAGIPQRFWKDSYDLVPQSLLYTKEDGTIKPIPQASQITYYNKLMVPDNLMKVPRLIVMGGIPTDEKAMLAACRVAKVAVKQWHSHVHVFDVAKYDKPQDRDRLVVMYNLSTSLYTPERLMKVKDYVRAYEDRTCILVVEGNPADYAFSILRSIRPNALIYFEGSLVINKSL